MSDPENCISVSMVEMWLAKQANRLYSLCTIGYDVFFFLQVEQLELDAYFTSILKLGLNLLWSTLLFSSGISVIVSIPNFPTVGFIKAFFYFYHRSGYF